MNNDRKEALRQRALKLSEGALDEYVRDLKNEEAATINNSGPEGQFEYLADNGGLRWIAEIVGQLSPLDDEDD